MRGADEQTGALFSYLSPEAMVPKDHPLQKLLRPAMVRSGWDRRHRRPFD